MSMWIERLRLRTLLAFVGFVALPAAAAVQGGIEVIDLPDGAQRATYGGRSVMVLPGSPPRAVVGIPLSAKAGRHEINVLSDTAPPTTIAFQVVEKKYPEQHITLKNQKMVNPDAADMPRIERETQQMLMQYERFFPLAASPFPLLRPAAGPVSGQFGARRILNGQPKNPHPGMDIAASSGTPILAPADGTVSLVGNFYFNGNTVFIDHGAGLISMFCHMSVVDVKEGDVVTRGHAIGKVGATGRATGPHLHWTPSMNAERVDPDVVLAAFPAKPTAVAGRP